MRTIRGFEERLHEEFATGDIPGFVHLYAGEEASAAGVCAHRDDERDVIASTHRGHGHCIAKHVDVKSMMAEIYGRTTGACHGKGGSMHTAGLSKGMLGANGIVGGGPPLICGAALAAKVRGDGGVGVAFFGDGGSNQGTTLESLNLAAVWRLPAVFVAENNGYAEATSAEWSVGGGSIAARAAARPSSRSSSRATTATSRATSRSTGRRTRCAAPAPNATVSSVSGSGWPASSRWLSSTRSTPRSPG